MMRKILSKMLEIDERASNKERGYTIRSTVDDGDVAKAVDAAMQRDELLNHACTSEDASEARVGNFWFPTGLRWALLNVWSLQEVRGIR